MLHQQFMYSTGKAIYNPNPNPFIVYNFQFVTTNNLLYLEETYNLSVRYTFVLPPISYFFQQENSLNCVQLKQCMTTTWPVVVVLVVASAKLITLARPVSLLWMAVAVPREHTWMKRGNVCPMQVVPAMIKTQLFLLDRLSSKMAPHGNYL